MVNATEPQKRRAIAGGFNPTIAALYKDKEMIAVNPFQADLYDTFMSATVRPSSATRGRYNQVSSEFWNAVHAVLAREKDAAAAVKDLDAKLHTINQNGNW